MIKLHFFKKTFGFTFQFKSANMGKLWAIGGYDGESNLSTVEVYDPEADSWTFVASMCAHGGGVGVKKSILIILVVILNFIKFISGWSNSNYIRHLHKFLS